MADSLIHDRGRGPELIGTRITVYNLIPHFLDATATEDYVCRLYDLTREQVAAARAYVMTNFAEVMAANARIDERIRREHEAQNTPENVARWERNRAQFERFRAWTASCPAGSPRVPFREWIADHSASVGEPIPLIVQAG